MRKVLPLLVALAVVFFVVFNISRKSSTQPTPPPTANGTPPATSNDNAISSAPEKVEVPRAADPGVAAVVDEMLAAWDKVSGLYATLETNMPQAAGHKGQTKGKGKYWVQKTDGRLKIRFELNNILQIEQEGGVLGTQEMLFTVIDGRNVYTYINQPGHKSAQKKKLTYDDVLHIGGPNLFRDLVENNKLTLLPEEMKNNRATKVLKAEPKDGSWQTIHHFDKATGVRLEMTELDSKGETALQIKVIEIDTNPTIGDEQFQPVVPEGVTLEDLTNTP